MSQVCWGLLGLIGQSPSSAGLPDEKFNKKPNSVQKRPQKDQTDARPEKAKLYLCYCHSVVINKHTKISLEIFFKIEKSCLALYWSTFLTLLWLFMVCEIAHFGYNGATVCILIYQQLSAPVRESSAIHSCTFKTRIIRALPFRRRVVAFLSRRPRPVFKRWSCSVLTAQYTVCTFPVIRQNITNIRTGVGLIKHLSQIFCKCIAEKMKY